MSRVINRRSVRTSATSVGILFTRPLALRLAHSHPPASYVCAVPERTSGPLRVTVIADSDTRWKWGALTARRIDPEARLDARLLRGRATPTARQLAELGIPADSMTEADRRRTPRRHRPGELRRPGRLACVGGTVQALLHGFGRAWRDRDRAAGPRHRIRRRRLREARRRAAAAGRRRCRPRQQRRRRAPVPRGLRRASAIRPARVVETALPFLGGDRYRPDRPRRRAAVHRHLRRTAVRPEGRARPAVPAAPGWSGTPASTPSAEVLVKLRSKPGEHTTHIEEHPYQKLVAALDPPDNVCARLRRTWARCSTAPTCWSRSAPPPRWSRCTAGIPTAVLTDLGIREPLGNHHFLGSGCLASWDELDDGHLPRGRPRVDRRARCGRGADPYAALRGPRRTSLLGAGPAAARSPPTTRCAPPRATCPGAGPARPGPRGAALGAARAARRAGWSRRAVRERAAQLRPDRLPARRPARRPRDPPLGAAMSLRLRSPSTRRGVRSRTYGARISGARGALASHGAYPGARGTARQATTWLRVVTGPVGLLLSCPDHRPVAGCPRSSPRPSGADRRADGTRVRDDRSHP